MNTQFFHHSWHRAWAGLGLAPAHELRDTLMACYREPHRRYHTLQHLHECLAQLENALPIAQHPAEVEIALWFHDAIYALDRHDNEYQSALWAKNTLEAAQLAPKSVARIAALVMATQHFALPKTVDEGLLVDSDLSILGANPARFAEYEAQVREEYGYVPDAVFFSKRKVILQAFLDRPFIYTTDYFRKQFEVQARGNLGRVTAVATSPH